MESPLNTILIRNHVVRVLHILSSPSSGGAEAFVKDMVLNSREIEIEPAIVFTSSASNLSRSTDYESRVLKELADQQIPYVVLPGNARRNPFLGRTAFKTFVKEFSPDCIHSHLQVGVLYCVLFCRPVSRVYTHHSSVVKSNHFVFKLLMRQCDQHVAISVRCAEILQQFLPTNQPCNLIYNAIDAKRVSEANRLSETEQVRLIAVGRISPAKNYLLMLQAVREVKKAIGAVFQLRIAGEAPGESEQPLTDYINEFGLGDVVELLGNRSDVANLLQQSDVFLMSSAWEGLPIALLEAQMAGIPALVTDVGGCVEVLDITHGGVAVEPNSVTAYKNALIELISNSEQRAIYSANAIKHRERFSIENCLKKHKEVYSLSIHNSAD